MGGMTVVGHQALLPLCAFPQPPHFSLFWGVVDGKSVFEKFFQLRFTGPISFKQETFGTHQNLVAGSAYQFFQVFKLAGRPGMFLKQVKQKLSRVAATQAHPNRFPISLFLIQTNPRRGLWCSSS